MSVGQIGSCAIVTNEAQVRACNQMSIAMALACVGCAADPTRLSCAGCAAAIAAMSECVGCGTKLCVSGNGREIWRYPALDASGPCRTGSSGG